MPLVSTIHGVGMTLLPGLIIVLSLQLSGVVMAKRPMSLMASEVWPWTIAGLGIMLTTGLLLFLTESVRGYGSIPFRTKMSFLLLAKCFTSRFSAETQADESLGVQAVTRTQSLPLTCPTGRDSF